MRIGYVLPNSWGLADPRDDVELAVLAETLGAGSLWVSHHVVHVDFVKERLGTGNYYDPLISLAAAAMATTTAPPGHQRAGARVPRSVSSPPSSWPRSTG